MADETALEPEQEELLAALVEAHRAVPRDKRRKFYFGTAQGNPNNLHHPGLPNGGDKISLGDLEVLDHMGYIGLKERTLRGTYDFDVMPQGFTHYARAKQHHGQQLTRIEAEVRSFLSADRIRRDYPEAFRKWSEAEALLWDADSEQQLTTIGHLCREALQEFAATLANRYGITNVPEDKAKTVARIRAVLNQRG